MHLNETPRVYLRCIITKFLPAFPSYTTSMLSTITSLLDDCGPPQSPLLTPPISPKVPHYTLVPSIKTASPTLPHPTPKHLLTPANYVDNEITNTKALPPLSWSNFTTELNWLNVFVICGVPVIGFALSCYTPLRRETLIFSIFYYFVTGMGITAGYHRLWAHRSYNASVFLQYYLAITAAGSVQGSIKWWCRGHRAHHRFTDTDLDPYNAHKGFFYSHVGWIMLKPRRRVFADVSDLTKSAVVRWQHKYFIPLLLLVSFAIPTLIPWYFWNDGWGGYVYAGIVRLVFVHHVRHLLLHTEAQHLNLYVSLRSASTRSRTG